jgi:hypothetical protein
MHGARLTTRGKARNPPTFAIAMYHLQGSKRTIAPRKGSATVSIMKELNQVCNDATG